MSLRRSKNIADDNKNWSNTNSIINSRVVKANVVAKSYGFLQENKGTVHADEIPKAARDPHTMTGYRDFGRLTAQDCVKTLFTVHNEIIDIWSHLIPALAFMLYFVYLLTIIGNPSVYPLLCFAFGGITVLLGSSLAHLFNCLSMRMYHICFYIDYATISIFTLTAAQMFFFYSRPAQTDSTLFASPTLYLSIGTCLGLLNMLLCCTSRHKLLSIQFYTRTLVMIVTWLYDTSPMTVRLLTCAPTEDCNPAAATLFYVQVACYMAAAVVNAVRIPERWAPGMFDLIGRSHHIMHVFVSLGYFYAFRAGFLDMIDRAQILSALPQPTVFTTFGLLGILISGNAAIGVICARTWLPDERNVLVMSKYSVIYNKEVNYEEQDPCNPCPDTVNCVG